MKILTLLVASSLSIQAAEWPTYRSNNRRSGTSEETLNLPLTKQWTHKGGTPQPAWTGPAKWDAYSANAGLQSMRNFDLCHYVSIANNKVYYGSSADNAVHCLDLKSGKELWVSFTNGAVRLPPSINQQKAFFGSDDGYAYCLDANTGKQIWKTSGAPSQTYLMSNGKLMSTHPIRTGVTLVNGQAIFGASLLPWNTSYLVSVNQNDGSPSGGYKTTSTDHTLQGAILHGAGELFVTQGRMAALKFDAKTGKLKGSMGQAGGITCLLTEDSQFIAGPQNQRSSDEQMRLLNAKGQHVATFNNANKVAIYKTMAYIHTNGKLKCLDRKTHSEVKSQQFDLKTITSKLKKQISNAKKQKKDFADLQKQYDETNKKIKALDAKLPATWKWEIKTDAPTDLIVAGDHLIVGYPNKVILYDKATGKSLATCSVDGIPYGLAVSNGSLIISSNKGTIYAFSK